MNRCTSPTNTRQTARVRALCKALLSIAVVASVEACSCRVNPPSQAYEFEGDCLEDLCGFTVDRGNAARTTSLVGGEHGLALEAGTRIVRDVESPWRGPVVSMMAYCESTATLAIEVTYETATRDGGATRLTRTDSATATGRPQWGELRMTLPSGAVYGGVVQRVVLENTGTARCIVDTIYVGDNRHVCQL